MVVCKCRKATKLYCFVHKVPVCGECICFPEHQICVVKTYSEWVTDGEYDWPPSCCQCHAVIAEGSDPQTTRLGCLHIIHTGCLVSHIKGFPPHTAPAGYACPVCSTPIWPPQSIKDSGSRLHAKLKEAIMETGLEKNLFGNHPVSMSTEPRSPPPAFASVPLKSIAGSSVAGTGAGSDEIVEIGGSAISNLSQHTQHPNFMESTNIVGHVATTRKNAFQVDRQNSDSLYYADDEDMNRKKYTKRGSFRHKFLRSLLPFWSSSLPTLPVTAPPKTDAQDASPDGRVRHKRSSRMDPRKILLVIAIMACLATMGILYYRLAQRGFGEEIPGDEQ